MLVLLVLLTNIFVAVLIDNGCTLLLAGFYYLISFYRAIIGLCTYFIVGALVMHFVYGAKGQDNIPNVNFWMDFPFLLRVSFLFETVMYQVVVVVDRMEFFLQSVLATRENQLEGTKVSHIRIDFQVKFN